MLELNIPQREFYDEQNCKFINVPSCKLKLEHSLISISKWEEKYHVPFLHTENKTNEQMIYYIKCMTINQVNDDNIYNYLPRNSLMEIIEYIKDKHTATWFSDKKPEGYVNNNKEIVTAEIIYYWMIELGVPIEFQKWHLEKLLTLIRVIEVKREKQEKMTPKQAAMQRQMLNMQRRAKYRSKG